MLYPVLFEPIYKEMLWGGSRLNSLYGKKSPFARTGESWEITCRPNEMGIVKNGVYRGMRFQDLINHKRRKWLGSNISGHENFPLLIKLIDAQDDLSIQVHPDDAFAKKYESDFFGKTEAWYVMEAPINGTISLGIKEGITRDGFLQAIEDGGVENFIHKLPVKKGDVLYIPPGLVHGLSKGIMVAEIQQNSDLTYRVYDYNRLGQSGAPRELHVEKAVAVADFENKLGKCTLDGFRVLKEEAELTYYLATPYFAIVKYEIQGSLTEETDGLKFCVFTCVEGKGKLRGPWGEVVLAAGSSAFVPACLGCYTLEGNAVLLKSWVPDIQEDFIKPLTEAGYSPEAIRQDF